MEPVPQLSMRKPHPFSAVTSKICHRKYERGTANQCCHVTGFRIRNSGSQRAQLAKLKSQGLFANCCSHYVIISRVKQQASIVH